MELFFEIIGWVGAVEVILAFLLNSIKKLSADSLAYLLLNLTGGLFLVVNTFYKSAYPSTVVNIIWVIIAIYALLKRGK